MRKQLFLGLFMLLTFSIATYGQTKKSSTMGGYKSLWEQVDRFEKDGQPKSALKVIDDILKQADKEKNTEQTIKALVKKNQNASSIDSDNNLTIITNLDKLLAKTSDIGEKAIINSMLADIYLSYYQRDRWSIDQRSKLTDFIPEDMKEWSSNIYFDKALFHLNQSVKDKDALLNISTDKYQELFEKGEDSKEFYPTLYDFLMKETITRSQQINLYDFKREFGKTGLTIDQLASTSDFLKAKLNTNLITLNFYQQYLKVLQDRKMENTIVLTELSRINYLTSQNTTFPREKTLLELEQKYTDKEISVEIINEIANSNRATFRRAINNIEEDVLDSKYEWLTKGINKFPNYKRINILKNQLNAMQQPTAQIEGLAVFHPQNKTKEFKLKYRNLKKVVATIKGTNGKVVKTIDIPLSPKKTYTMEEATVALDLETIGNYVVELSFDKKTTQNNKEFNFSISQLATFSRAIDDKTIEFYVVDRLTGKPLKDASVSVYTADRWKENRQLLKEVKTDAMGIATYSSVESLTADNRKKDYSFKVSLGTDNQKGYTSFPYYYTFSDNVAQGQEDKLQVFLDRDIYRPGQTVYFKAIATRRQDKNVSLLTKGVYSVKLFDANNQELSHRSYIANDFGSLSGEFILPQSGLNGTYRIQVGDNTTYFFTVEEYKRPTFQITFDKTEETYSFGDKVTLKGHAENFSGVKLQDATVEYYINKNSFMRWGYSNGEFIESGTVTTGTDGSFDISFVIPKNESNNSIGKGYFYFPQIYSFNIDATITDENGETQSGSTNVVVGNVSMNLSVDIESQLNKNTEKEITISATNLAGLPYETKGKLELFRVEKQDTTSVLKQDFSTGGQTKLLQDIKRLSSGNYLLKLSANDDKGREVKSESAFVLYSFDDKKPPIETNEWFVEKNTTFGKGKDGEIVVGVSASDATILYDLIKDNKVLAREQIKLSNSNKLIKIPYKEVYGEGISATFTYVIAEKAYTKTIYLTKETEKKDLTLKFEVFRDKLRPGATEEWRISVKDNKDKPALAEVLASMYDLSLDKISPSQNWMFNPISIRSIYTSNFDQGRSFENLYGYFSFEGDKYLDVQSYRFDRLNMFGYNVLNYDQVLQGRVAGVAIKSKSLNSAPQMALAESVVSEDKNYASEESAVPSAGAGVLQKAEVPQPQIRQNFNETAFFYPHLKTNEKGETIISFTVPESNTSWKFRALAYDKNLSIGTLDAISVSRKELMVIPNMPRFLRQGDKASISAKVANMSEGAIAGTVKLEFFNPLTDKVSAIAIANQSQQFSIEKDGSSAVKWSFEVPQDIELLGCRVVAENETFSDGEQHVLSVLPNRMLVTESMLMNVNGAQEKEFKFDKLANNKSNSLSNYKLTLEYAGNPAWYAIQALPVLSNPTNENAVNWFASYYANTLGSFIVNKYPKVSAMLKAWKQEGASKETLVSKLQKNEELKAVLLEETPWVLDAKNETDQMQRLSMLFDLNNTNMQRSSAISKLSELQSTDGGWSWYQGMRPSRAITQYILYGFTSLINLNAVEYPSDVKVMQMNALKFIDEAIKKDFDDLKKNNKDWSKMTSISTNQLEYLYVRSAYRDIPINQETREAERFYTSVVEKNWRSLNLYEKSILAVLLQRNGNKELTNKLMTSIREHSTTNDEMGMFWANNRSQSFVSNSAISVHTFLMDAFKEMKASDKEMDGMKQWLLKQKQTQLWESTHATVDAVNALLSTGSDWFASEGNVKIAVDKKEVKADSKELGTTYVKHIWGASEMNSKMANVKISKSDNGPSYGAMYWQYYEDLDKITTQKGELGVSKKLFVEKTSDNGKTLVEVTANSPLKVGDKVVVRLTVRADRDFDFVQLKDMRASCFEPTQALSGVQWKDKAVYYQSTKDASTNYFFDYLAKGTYVFEYPVYVNREGEYSNGITTIQCMYAPEFISHTSGERVTVK